jgi:hypothetical protein
MSKIRIKMIIYPLFALFCYYILVHLPMSMGNKHKNLIYDEKTGIVYAVK